MKRQRIIEFEFNNLFPGDLLYESIDVRLAANEVQSRLPDKIAKCLC